MEKLFKKIISLFTKNNVETYGEIAQHTGNLGIEICDIAGEINEVSERLKQQNELCVDLRQATKSVLDDNQEIVRATDHALTVSKETSNQFSSFSDNLAVSVKSIGLLVGKVEGIEEEIEKVATAVAEVRKIAHGISEIAQQSHLLSVNAAIEAARSSSNVGSNSSGFAVVAKEFKTLSEKTASHTALVEKSLMQLALNVTNLISISGDNIKLAQEVKACNSSIDHIVKNANNSLLNITSELSTIAEQTHSIDNKCNNLGIQVDKISKGTILSTDNFENAHHRINNLLSASETLIQLTAHMGAQTEDSKFIDLAKKTAKIIGKRFEQAINNNEITLEDLFDHNYQLIANTNPQQMMAKFTRFTDKVLPDFQEPLLDFDSKIVFTAAVDINGYLPTHNNKFSHPQTNDHVWNAANCRNRRLFNDRTGLAAGKNTNDFLLQTYRRDMGGGNFALMKDVSAPIMVKGQHWGGFRIGYKV